MLYFTQSFGAVETSSTPSYPLDRIKFSGQFTIRLPYPGKMATGTLLNPLNAELNPICHLLALLRTHPILHVSRIRVNNTRLGVSPEAA